MISIITFETQKISSIDTWQYLAPLVDHLAGDPRLAALQGVLPAAPDPDPRAAPRLCPGGSWMLEGVGRDGDMISMEYPWLVTG